MDFYSLVEGGKGWCGVKPMLDEGAYMAGEALTMLLEPGFNFQSKFDCPLVNLTFGEFTVCIGVI